MKTTKMMVAASVAALLIGCKGPTPTAGADAGGAPNALPMDLNVRVVAICQKLATAGVAKNCSGVTGTPKAGWLMVHFDVVGAGKPQEAKVQVFFNEHAAHGNDVIWASVTPDNFPDQHVTSTPDTSWGPWDVNWVSSDAWSACLKKQAVPACAKQHAGEYEAFHKLHDAAKRIAAER